MNKNKRLEEALLDALESMWDADVLMLGRRIGCRECEYIGFMGDEFEENFNDTPLMALLSELDDNFSISDQFWEHCESGIYSFNCLPDNLDYDFLVEDLIQKLPDEEIFKKHPTIKEAYESVVNER